MPPVTRPTSQSTGRPKGALANASMLHTVRPWTVGVIPGTRQPDMPPIGRGLDCHRPWTTPAPRSRRKSSEDKTWPQRRRRLKPLVGGDKDLTSWAPSSSSKAHPWLSPPAWLCEQYWMEDADRSRGKAPHAFAKPSRSPSKLRTEAGSRLRRFANGEQHFLGNESTPPLQLGGQIQMSARHGADDDVSAPGETCGKDGGRADAQGCEDTDAPYTISALAPGLDTVPAEDRDGRPGHGQHVPQAGDTIQTSQDATPWNSLDTAWHGRPAPQPLDGSFSGSQFLEQLDELALPSGRRVSWSNEKEGINDETIAPPPTMPCCPYARQVYSRRRGGRQRSGDSDDDVVPKGVQSTLTPSMSSSSLKRSGYGWRAASGRNQTSTVTIGNLSLKLTSSVSGKSFNAIRLASVQSHLPLDTVVPMVAKEKPVVSFEEEDDHVVTERRRLSLTAIRGAGGDSMASRMTVFGMPKGKDDPGSPEDHQSQSEDPLQSSGSFRAQTSPQEDAEEARKEAPKKAFAEEKPTKTPEERCGEAFRKLQDDRQLHRDDLPRALELAGITNPTLEWVDEVFDSITKFSTIGEMEFIRFVSLYLERQHQAFAEAFEKCDIDGSGYVEFDELAALLSDLGVEPMHHVLVEVINEVDEDGQGSLDLDEFMKVMDIIRVRECFTKREHEEFLRVYNRFDCDGSGDMDTKELMNLLNWLGYTVCEQEANDIVLEVDVDGTGTINEREFLICMRKVREREVAAIKEAFALCDDDGNGTISPKELDATMRALGYVTDPQAVKDAISEADLDEDDDELDVSEFFRLLDIYRQREGLSADDLTQLESAFDHYDKDGIGELSTLDVGKVLRFLGYPIPFEQQQTFVTKVDVDRSGKLQLCEMKKMIRMYREMEIEAMRTVYDKFIEESGGCTPTNIVAAVRELELPGGLRPEVTLTPADVTGDDGAEVKTFTFLQFVHIVGRALRAARKAFKEDGGFTKWEVKELRLQFDAFDQDGSGDISNKELINVIECLFPLVANDPTMRPKLLELLQEVDQDGNGSLDFSDFLQLMRQFKDLTDRENAAKENLAIEETGMNQQEVNEYREVFLAASWTNGTKITLEETKELIAAVCPLGDKNATELTKMFRAITGNKLKDPAEFRDEADFAEFLLFIKQLLDSNFAQILERSRAISERS